MVLGLNVLWAPVNLMVGICRGAGLTPVAIGAIRWSSFAALLALLLRLPAFRKLTGAAPLPPAKWGACFALGLTMFGPAHMLFYTGLERTSDVEGTVLLTLAPLWTGVFAFFILGERMTTERGIALALSVIGAYIVTVGFRVPVMTRNTAGNLLFGGGVLLECAMGTLTTRLARQLSGVSVLSALLFGCSMSFWLAALFLPGILPFSASGVGTGGWLALAYLVIGSGLVTFTVWYRIVEQAPLTLLVIGIAAQVPIAALLSYLVRGAHMTTQTLIGALLILAALAIGFRPRAASTPA